MWGNQVFLHDKMLVFPRRAAEEKAIHSDYIHFNQEKSAPILVKNHFAPFAFSGRHAGSKRDCIIRFLLEVQKVDVIAVLICENAVPARRIIPAAGFEGLRHSYSQITGAICPSGSMEIRMRGGTLTVACVCLACADLK